MDVRVSERRSIAWQLGQHTAQATVALLYGAMAWFLVARCGVPDYVAVVVLVVSSAHR